MYGVFTCVSIISLVGIIVCSIYVNTPIYYFNNMYMVSTITGIENNYVLKCDGQQYFNSSICNNVYDNIASTRCVQYKHFEKNVCVKEKWTTNYSPSINFNVKSPIVPNIVMVKTNYGTYIKKTDYEEVGRVGDVSINITNSMVVMYVDYDVFSTNFYYDKIIEADGSNVNWITSCVKSIYQPSCLQHRDNKSLKISVEIAGYQMYFIYTCKNDDGQCNNFKLNNKKGDKIITHVTVECGYYTSDHAYCANRNYPEKLEYVNITYDQYMYQYRLRIVLIVCILVCCIFFVASFYYCTFWTEGHNHHLYDKGFCYEFDWKNEYSICAGFTNVCSNLSKLGKYIAKCCANCFKCKYKCCLKSSKPKKISVKFVVNNIEIERTISLSSTDSEKDVIIEIPNGNRVVLSTTPVELSTVHVPVALSTGCLPSSNVPVELSTVHVASAPIMKE